MTFRVGMEVVCIKDKWNTVAEGHPKKGDVATVTGIYPHTNGLIKCDHISLAEFPAKYAIVFFRPVVRTDISIFTAMLDKAPKREVVDA
ncbi:hypothetical protein [Taklimakanibacter deserti]|uniref:hypothetical protein n=1 Tax=Taklimakanibacter deserti TaxID=2267839 RepID=UPI0013C4040E